MSQAPEKPSEVQPPRRSNPQRRRRKRPNIVQQIWYPIVGNIQMAIAALRRPFQRRRSSRRPSRERFRLRDLGGMLLSPFLAIIDLFRPEKRSRKSQASSQWGPKARQFVAGLPALLLTFGFTGLILSAGFLQNDEELSERYRQAADAAREKEDFETEQVYRLRHAMLYSADPERRYQLALAADAQSLKLLRERQKIADKKERSAEEDAQLEVYRNDIRQAYNRAQGIMRSLASLQAQGYWPAHLWQARRMLAIPGLNQTRFDNAQAHLRRAYYQQPNNPDINRLLADLYLRRQLGEKAEPHLRKLADSEPKYLLNLAELHAARNQRQEAIELATRARQRFGDRLLRDPSDREARLHLARANVQLQQFGTAVELLRYGLQQTPKDPAFTSLLASTLVLWSDQVIAESSRNAPQRLSLIEQAIAEDHFNADAIRRILVLRHEPSPEGQRAAAILQQMLDDPAAPASLFFAVGTDAFAHDANEEARKAFERAYQLNPNAVLIVNNLAWSLAFSEPTDSPRALELMNKAVTTFPTNANLRETRGQIHAQLRNWNDALIDLQMALPYFRDNLKTHQTLATVYRELNNPRLADEHEKIAAQIAQRPTKTAHPLVSPIPTGTDNDPVPDSDGQSEEAPELVP